MNLTTKNFETSFELTEYLKSVLAGYKEIFFAVLWQQMRPIGRQIFWKMGIQI